MPLLISLFVLALLALFCFQAWQLWFTRRELARLEQRLAESLDDQDLLEFQDRLKGLLNEARDAGLNLAQTLERRQGAAEKVIAQAMEIEKRLNARAQLAELASKIPQRTLGTPAKAAALKTKKKAAKPKPKPKAAAPEAKAPKIPPPEREAPKPRAEAPEAGGESRSYLSRPVVGTANQSPARHQQVYELADSGLNREQIAREASLLPGEVELILNLRPGKKGQK